MAKTMAARIIKKNPNCRSGRRGYPGGECRRRRPQRRGVKVEMQARSRPTIEAARKTQKRCALLKDLTTHFLIIEIQKWRLCTAGNIAPTRASLLPLATGLQATRKSGTGGADYAEEHSQEAPSQEEMGDHDISTAAAETAERLFGNKLTADEWELAGRQRIVC